MKTIREQIESGVEPKTMVKGLTESRNKSELLQIAYAHVTDKDLPKFKDYYRKIAGNDKDGRNPADVWQDDLYQFSRMLLKSIDGKNPSEHEATDLYDVFWSLDKQTH